MAYIPHVCKVAVIKPGSVRTSVKSKNSHEWNSSEVKRSLSFYLRQRCNKYMGQHKASWRHNGGPVLAHVWITSTCQVVTCSITPRPPVGVNSLSVPVSRQSLLTSHSNQTLPPASHSLPVPMSVCLSVSPVSYSMSHFIHQVSEWHSDGPPRSRYKSLKKSQT